MISKVSNFDLRIVAGLLDFKKIYIDSYFLIFDFKTYKISKML